MKSKDWGKKKSYLIGMNTRGEMSFMSTRMWVGLQGAGRIVEAIRNRKWK